MATLAVTNDFSAGTTIVAADMNTNFSDIETFVNSSPGLVQNTLVDAKGDLLAASADDDFAAGVGQGAARRADVGAAEAVGLAAAAERQGEEDGTHVCLQSDGSASFEGSSTLRDSPLDHRGVRRGPLSRWPERGRGAGPRGCRWGGTCARRGVRRGRRPPCARARQRRGPRA